MDPLSARLENDELSIEIFSDIPVVHAYTHKQTGLKFGGADRNAQLKINGQLLAWADFEIAANIQKTSAAYSLSLATGLSFDIAFNLNGNELCIELKNIEDGDSPLKSLEWIDLPILVCNDPDFHYWRLHTSEPDHNAMGKMWLRDAGGVVRDTKSEAQPVPLIYGTLFKPDELCVFVDSNYPLFPQTHQITGDGRCAISLNEFRYRVRSKTVEPLKAKVVFLGDLNSDGRIDLSDYRLWVNRNMPDGDPLYLNTIWYKIQCDISRHPPFGVVSTFKQGEEIIRAIHNVTDGLPQIAYFVNWHSHQGDGAYPSLDVFNEGLGSREELYELAETCKKELNTIVSYHANIDDVHTSSKDFDESLVGYRYAAEGTGFHEGEKAYDTRIFGGLCHTRDVETGKIFERLTGMMNTVPVEKTIHLDNMRLTNCDPKLDPEGIGVIEELICGLLPIAEWLKQKGITITTEGYNGLPADPARYASGFWHHDPTDSARQIYHRKIMGGGRGDHYGGADTMDFGLCKSIHQDFTYDAIDEEAIGAEKFHEIFHWLPDKTKLTLSFKKDWLDIVERIYLGTLLYQFFLEREMLSSDKEGEGYRIKYADDVEAEVCIDSKETLKVRWKNIAVADGGDRFIPRDGAVYAYSVEGGKRTWALPDTLQGKDLEVFSLTKEGRGPAPEFRVEGDSIILTLEPKSPVKIAVKGT